MPPKRRPPPLGTSDLRSTTPNEAGSGPWERAKDIVSKWFPAPSKPRAGAGTSSSSSSAGGAAARNTAGPPRHQRQASGGGLPGAYPRGPASNAIDPPAVFYAKQLASGTLWVLQLLVTCIMTVLLAAGSGGVALFVIIRDVWGAKLFGSGHRNSGQQRRGSDSKRSSHRSDRHRHSKGESGAGEKRSGADGLRRRHVAGKDSPQSERRRRFVVSVADTPHMYSDDSGSGGSCSDSGDDGGLGFLRSSSYYYDVEEASYQPTTRLLFGHEYTTGDGEGVPSTPTIVSGSGGAQSLPAGMYSNHARTRSFSGGFVAIGSSTTGSRSASAAVSQMTKSGRNTLLSPLVTQQYDTGFDAAASELDLRRQRHFVGHYGDKVNGGAFQLVAEIGRGAYSSVWLAVDRKGITAKTTMGMMLRYRQSSNTYNASAVVNRNVPAYIVLKISKRDRLFVSACESEFETNRRLAEQLRRRQMRLDMVSLWMMFFLEQSRESATPPPGPSGSSKGTPQGKGGRKSASPANGSKGAKGSRNDTPLSQGRSSSFHDANIDGNLVDHHFVQVSDVCGPSLLHLISNAGPPSCHSAADQLWRIRIVRHVTQQLFTALDASHRCGIVHTDVKPENVLLALPAVEVLEKMRATTTAADEAIARHRTSLITEYAAWDRVKSGVPELEPYDHDDLVGMVAATKLTDFGSAEQGPMQPIPTSEWAANRSSNSESEPAATEPPVGLLQTREYRSPEVILGLPRNTALTGAMDIWSAACVVYELLTSQYLFNPRHFLEQQHQQARANSAGKQGGGAARSASSGSTPQPPNGDSLAGDSIHLAMMRELLQRAVPPEMVASGAKSSQLEIDTADPAPAANSGSTSSKTTSDSRRGSSAAGEDEEGSIAVVSSNAAIDETPEDTRRTLLPVLIYEQLVRPLRNQQQQEASAASSSSPSSSSIKKLERELEMATDFVASALVMNPSNRPTAAGLLRHPWMIYDQ